MLEARDLCGEDGGCEIDSLNRGLHNPHEEITETRSLDATMPEPNPLLEVGSTHGPVEWKDVTCLKGGICGAVKSETNIDESAAQELLSRDLLSGVSRAGADLLVVTHHFGETDRGTDAHKILTVIAPDALTTIHQTDCSFVKRVREENAAVTPDANPFAIYAHLAERNLESISLRLAEFEKAIQEGLPPEGAKSKLSREQRELGDTLVESLQRIKLFLHQERDTLDVLHDEEAIRTGGSSFGPVIDRLGVVAERTRESLDTLEKAFINHTELTTEEKRFWIKVAVTGVSSAIGIAELVHNYHQIGVLFHQAARFIGELYQYLGAQFGQ